MLLTKETEAEAGQIDWLARLDPIAKQIAARAALHDADDSFVHES